MIPIALVHPLVAIPLAFFTFYKGYQGIMMGQGYFKTYKLCETIIITGGFIVWVLSIQGYHGPLFLIQLMNEPKKSDILVYLVIAENVVMVLSLLLRTVCLMKVVDFYDTEDAGMIKL